MAGRARPLLWDSVLLLLLMRPWREATLCAGGLGLCAFLLGLGGGNEVFSSRAWGSYSVWLLFCVTATGPF